MIIRNKDVIQSYIFTAAKYSYDIYEKRFMLKMAEIANADINGKKLDVNYTIDKAYGVLGK